MPTRGAVVGLLALVIMLGALLLLVPEWQGGRLPAGIEKDAPKLINEYRRTLAQSIAGFVLLLGLYFTWRTLHVTREGQITERFTNAIDQLAETTGEDGQKNVEARMGGIYALERIARESERDHWAIMDILTAYVRQHAHPNVDGNPSRTEHSVSMGILSVRIEHYTHPREQEDRIRESEAEEESAKNASNKRNPNADHPSRLDADIQAVMNVIRRRKYYYGKRRRVEWLRKLPTSRLRTPYKVKPINLSGTDLHGAKLWAAHLENTSLRGVNFQNAEFENAYLQGADLQDADLQDADLQDADLRGADLRGTDLRGADLRGADLRGADLRGASGLTQEQINCTVGPSRPELPERLKQPKLWGKGPGEQKRKIKERVDKDERVDKASIMPFVRWGAIGSVTAGVAWVMLLILNLLVRGNVETVANGVAQEVSRILAQLGPRAVEVPLASTPFHLIELAYALAEAGMLVALVSLYVLQPRSLGKLGIAGFAVAIIGNLLLLVSTLGTIISSIFLYQFGKAVTGFLFGLGLLGWFAGFVLLGVATFQARVLLGRWLGGLLIACALLASPLPMMIGLPFEVSLVAAGPLWLILGYALWRRKDALTEQATRVT